MTEHIFESLEFDRELTIQNFIRITFHPTYSDMMDFSKASDLTWVDVVGVFLTPSDKPGFIPRFHHKDMLTRITLLWLAILEYWKDCKPEPLWELPPNDIYDITDEAYYRKFPPTKVQEDQNEIEDKKEDSKSTETK